MSALLLSLPFRATDANGQPMAGAKLYFYQTGTTTPTPAYSDNGLAVALSNPVVADSGGKFASIYLDPSVTYRAVLKDASGATTIFDSDPIGGGQTSPLSSSIGVFSAGRAAPIAGSKAQINWLRDDLAFPLENEAGIWSGPVSIGHGINKSFDGTMGGSGAPCAALFVMASNNGSGGDVCGAIFESVARVDNRTVFGANIIVRSGGSGKAGIKYVGLEIDVECAAGDTAIDSGSGGLFLNVFSKALPGPAILTGGVSGGSFNNGIVLGGLAATAAGLALNSASQANSLVNTTVGTFNGVAITMGQSQGRGLLWQVASKNAQIYHDGTNMRVVAPASGGAWVFRNSADTASLLAVNDTGTGGQIDAQGTTPYFSVNGTKVVGARQTGTAANATDLTSVITLANDLKTKLVAHGLIA